MKLAKRTLLLLTTVIVAVACSSDLNKVTNPPPTDIEIGLPADPTPKQYSNFFKRFMFLDHTGTGCGNCPLIIKLINEIEKTEYADNIVVVAAHSYNRSDPMYNPFSLLYREECKIEGYPTVTLDMRTSPNASIETLDISKVIVQCNALENEYPAKVAIAAKVAFRESYFIVNAAVKIGTEGKYNIGAVVLESGIKALQVNYHESDNTIDYNTHNHAVRGGFPEDSVSGMPLNEGNIIESGQTIKKNFVIPVPPYTNPDNASIVIYVSTADEEGGKPYINNVIVCKAGKEVPFKYKN